MLFPILFLVKAKLQFTSLCTSPGAHDVAGSQVASLIIFTCNGHNALAGSSQCVPTAGEFLLFQILVYTHCAPGILAFANF